MKVRNNIFFLGNLHFFFLKKKGSKGAVQIDYIIAAGVFIAVFAYLVQYTTGYYASVKDVSDILVLRSEAFALQSIADRGPEPSTWPELQKDNGMVLLMHFNNDTLDYSGLGNNGTPMSGVNCSSSVQGRLKSACSFDGEDDVIDAGSSSSIDNLSSITVAAWIYPKSQGENNLGRIADKANETNGWLFYLGNTNRLNFLVYYMFVDLAVMTASANSVSFNVWQHVVMTWNGTSNANGVRYYINGVEIATTQQNASGMKSGDDNFNLTIGNNNASTRTFNGTIDEVAIYNRALSAAEVLDIYQQGLQRIGLQSYAYRFYIHVNYSQPFWRNQSNNVSNLTNELVNISLSSVLPAADIYSIAIYNSTGGLVPYQISDRKDKNITFSANISVNASQWFMIYVDDDTVFPDTSTTITGIDNISETVFPVEKVSLLQYEKILQLNLSDYTAVRNSADVKNNFNIKILDTSNNQTFIDYGGSAPRRGNVIALQRFIIYQNATAAIKNGKMIVQVWK